MKRRGFAYIIAVLMLGLLAFMGVFLMQSSSTEYSHAALSVYATMAHQLAESAADEAFQKIEWLFKDSKKGPLLRQAATSNLPAAGGPTGLNPELLDILPDFKGQVVQTSNLTSSHMNRVKFEIDQVMPVITDCRPIDHGTFTDPECVYKPKDHTEPFDTVMSRDFFLSIGFNIKISVRAGGTKRTYRFSLTRDMKLINVGPIARNYTLFSLAGPVPGSQEEVENDLSRGNGRLVLWNHPFQSRVYLHGPYVIGIENPDFREDEDKGAYITTSTDPKPGINQAFQYAQTYNGLSYLPFPARALWEGKKIFGAQPEQINDVVRDDATAAEKEKYENHNTHIKGMIPMESSTWWDEIKDYYGTGGDSTIREYLRGRLIKQKFLPAGPFCRFPWKYIPPEPKPNYAPNRIDEDWPKPDEMLRIEHRYVTQDSQVDDQTKIYADLMHHKLISLAGFRIGKPTEYPLRVNPEFALTYGNHRDPEGIWEKIGAFFTELGKRVWNGIAVPAKLIYAGGESIFRIFVKPTDPSAPEAVNRSEQRNLYPTNFKLFTLATTHKFKDETEIPVDENGLWILDGVYWLDSFQTQAPVVYKGCGMIIVTDYNADKPFTIRGSIMAQRNDDGTRTPSHLTIVYSPYTRESQLPPLDQCQIYIEGTGNIIEASVFSLAGIRTTTGVLDDNDFASLGMDPKLPTQDWNLDVQRLSEKVNTIRGNYSNLHMKKHRIDGDLWIIHDRENPLFFTNDQLNVHYGEEHEILAHAAVMSPKIQHISIAGDLPEAGN